LTRRVWGWQHRSERDEVGTTLTGHIGDAVCHAIELGGKEPE